MANQSDGRNGHEGNGNGKRERAARTKDGILDRNSEAACPDCGKRMKKKKIEGHRGGPVCQLIQRQRQSELQPSDTE